MTLSTLASDPAVLALFERVCALVTARGSGITLRQLGAASALARAVVEGDHARAENFAHQLGLDVEGLT